VQIPLREHVVGVRVYLQNSLQLDGVKLRARSFDGGGLDVSLRSVRPTLASRKFPDDPVKNRRRTNSLCKRPDVLTISVIKEITLAGPHVITMS
jgi:hypothetical protein